MKSADYYLNKIKKLGIRNTVCKALGYDSAYTCCYKLKNGREYTALPLNRKEWYADPLVIKRDGRTYVFMEVFDEKSHLGRIGYSEITESGWGEVKVVISEQFHLSFPTIIEMNDKLYMIPETSTADKICLYECIEFPDNWKLAKTFLEGEKIVDSIIIENKDNRVVMLASKCHEDNSLLYKFFEYDIVFGETITLCVKDGVNNRQPYCNYHRNAGGVTSLDEIPLQVSSDVIYGESMVFVPRKDVIKAVSSGEILDYNRYRKLEKNDREIIGIINKNVVGIHTYSETEDYEVIDLQFFRFSIHKWKERLRLG